MSCASPGLQMSMQGAEVRTRDDQLRRVLMNGTCAGSVVTYMMERQGKAVVGSLMLHRQDGTRAGRHARSRVSRNMVYCLSRRYTSALQRLVEASIRESINTAVGRQGQASPS